MTVDDEESRIRIMHGGPFYELMSWLGLRKRGWRALCLALLAWVVPVLMLLSTGGAYLAGLFLQDWGAWAKFLIAPILLTLSEKPIAFAIDECTSLVFRVPLLASVSRTEGRKALERARERTVATIPEAICLLLAFAASGANAASFLGGNAPSWASSAASQTLAGVWCLAVSNTIYWFLLSRLIWKHLVWAAFLSDISDCRLRLVVTHPDDHAGLGFLGFYPAGYGLFTLAVSCVAAAAIGHVMERQPLTPTLFTIICAAWLVIVTLYYVLPLFKPGAKIVELKKKTILLAMAKATDYERWNERTTLGSNMCDDLQEEQFAELHDIKPIWTAALRTSGLLINRKNMVVLLVPALLPLLAAGAAFLPYSQLGPVVKRLLLL
ncbi:hypothetical protein [Rhizobium lusitanum]|uniref:hypothetical protein n=1 Tax=Rhizobium lusitanum TaxID=293958 RepID=UPI0032B244D3